MAATDDIFKFISEKYYNCPIDHKVSIGSGNGLATTRRQAITRENADKFISASHGVNELYNLCRVFD